ncbi:MAG: hypothetical protein LBI79_06360 [Nitrososphaerota archaeon]|jgi:hypothetical protein|nr:hypothetical protein [Nitrososphaerota archaeon]
METLKAVRWVKLIGHVLIFACIGAVISGLLVYIGSFQTLTEWLSPIGMGFMVFLSVFVGFVVWGIAIVYSKDLRKD